MEAWGFVVEWTPSALLAAAILLLLTGRMKTRRDYLDMRADRDQWKATTLELLDQNRELLAAAQVTNEVLKALPTPDEERSA